MCSQPQSPRILLTGRSKAVERLLRNQRNTKLPKLAISSIRHRYLIAKRHAKRWPVELHEKAETINLMVPFASGVFSSAAVLGNEGWASSLNKLVRKCWLFDETTRACGIPSTTNYCAVAYGYAVPSILQRSDCSPDSLMLWYRYNFLLGRAFGREHPGPLQKAQAEKRRDQETSRHRRKDTPCRIAEEGASLSADCRSLQLIFANCWLPLVDRFVSSILAKSGINSERHIKNSIGSRAVTSCPIKSKSIKRTGRVAAAAAPGALLIKTNRNLQQKCIFHTTAAAIILRMSNERAFSSNRMASRGI